MGADGSKFNVCVSAGADLPDMIFRFTLKDGEMTVGAVIDKITETIAGGLEDEKYEYEWDAEVTGLVPYFGDEWSDLPEGEPARAQP